MNLDSDAGPAAAPYGLAVSASGSSALVVSTTQHLAALNLSDSATATIAANGTTVLMTNGLTVDPTAKLDVANNVLVVNYSGASPLAAVQSLIKAGQGTVVGGLPQWNGAGGITSSTAKSNVYTSLGVRDMSVPLATEMTPPTSIEGVPISANSVVVKYTWYGDLNLDGKVTYDDYSLFIHDFENQDGLTMEWATGDLNGDGQITYDDYSLLIAGYEHQSGTLSAGEQITPAEIAAGYEMFAPEPATLALMALGGAILAAGRRRRSGHRGLHG